MKDDQYDKTHSRPALDFNALTMANVTRCEAASGFGHNLNDWTPLEWAGAMCGEAGEAANIAKKLRRIQGMLSSKLNKGATEDELIEKLGREIADVIIYADLLCTRVGLILGNEVAKAFNAKSREIGSDVLLPEHCPIL